MPQKFGSDRIIFKKGSKQKYLDGKFCFAFAYYRQGKFAKSYLVFQELSNFNHSIGKLYFGISLSSGFGVEKNEIEGVRKMILSTEYYEPFCANSVRLSFRYGWHGFQQDEMESEK